MPDSTRGVARTGLKGPLLCAETHALVNPRSWGCASRAHDPAPAPGSRGTGAPTGRNRESPRLPQGWHWVATSGTPRAGAAERAGDDRANGTGEGGQAGIEGQQDILVRIAAILYTAGMHGLPSGHTRP
ncbi:MAG TPA: hypothetical protein VFO16_01385 [Pseudonocardiaceae bacterium]|nr:hypothetical protein [Pseudonocardiaceae bacterium]